MTYPSPLPEGRRRKRFPVGLALFFTLVLGALVAGLWGALRLYQGITPAGGPGTAPEITSRAGSPIPPLDDSPDLSLEQTRPEWRVYDFEYRCLPYSVNLQLYGSVSDYYASRDKDFYYRGSLPSDWEARYYLQFLDSEGDLEALRALIAGVKEGTGASGDEIVLALVSLVQNLTYDCDKLFSFQDLEGTDYQTSFPYETLYMKQGVCGDTSLLLGKILSELGYGAAFLVYEQTNHMAVGIRCPVETATIFQDGLGYCYIETTAPTRIGVKPGLVSGVPFNEEPQVIPFAEGRSFDLMASLVSTMQAEALAYGDYILELAGCQEISLYKEIHDREAGLSAYETRLEELKVEIDTVKGSYGTEAAIAEEMGCKGTVSRSKYEQCQAQISLVNQKADSYNLLVNQYNQLVDEYQQYYQEYELIFLSFEALVQEKYPGCSYISPEDLSIQTPVGEGE